MDTPDPLRAAWEAITHFHRPTPTYDIILHPGARCASGHAMALLSPRASGATFYLCWECHQVYEAGCGPVPVL